MSRCVRAGCSGTYGPEGSCDKCGQKAPAGDPVELPGTAAAMMTVGGSTRRSTSTRRALSRGGLGAGLIDMPRVPLRDPATAVLAACGR